MSSSSRWLVVAVALLLMAAPLFGASQNAVIYGTVYDASANPMPGVTVTLENSAVGFSRTTVTGSDGSYNFAEVPPADGYKLTATKAGKVIDTRTGITVNVGEESVLAPPLKEQAPVVAGTTTKNEPVTQVEKKSVRTETVSTSQSGVITGEQLRALPLYNRNFLALGGITPNVHDLSGGDPLLGASFSVGGQRGTANNFLLDGADNVASSSNQAVPFQVNDAVQEFRLISNNAPAEYGRSSGGMVNIVTRRGGNNWHGSAFGYFGSDVLNGDGPISIYRNTGFFKAARYAGSQTPVSLGTGLGNFFTPVNYNEYVATAAANGFCTNSISGTAFPGSVPCGTGGFGLNTLFDPAKVLSTRNSFKAPFSSQQAGFNIGGPVVKDKVFMFGSYEGTRIDNPNPIFERVPSTFDRTFNALTVAGAPNASPYIFPSNSPDYLIAANLMSLYPQPNVIAVPNALEFFQGEAPNYTHVHNALGRVDWVQNADNNWSFRYVAQLLHQLHDDTLPSQRQYPGNGAFRDVLNQNLNIGQSHTFSASLINEAHVGFNRFNVEDEPQDQGFNPKSALLPGPQMPTILLTGIDPQYAGAAPGTVGPFANWFTALFGNSVMAPSLDGLFPMARLGAPLNAPTRRTDMTWFISDGVSWTTGKHSFKFGAEFRRLTNEFKDGSYSRGFMNSENIGEFNSDSLNTFTGYFAPSFDYFVRQAAPYGTSFHSYAFGGYVQDTVRLDPKLTLTLGLRYDLYSTPTEDHNQIWNFDPKSNGLVQQGGNAVLDPFGHTCNSFGFFDVAPISLAAFLSSWNCSASPQNYRITNRNTDFAPRVGVVWDPLGNGRTILRGGAGMFYDQVPVSFMSQLMYNRPVDVTKAVPNTNVIYGNQLGLFAFGNNSVNSLVDPVLQPGTSPFAVYARDPNNANTPYSWQFNLTWQQQITNRVVSEIGYVGAMSNKLPLIYNQNFNNEYTPSGATDGELGFFPIFTMTNQGEANYNSLMARVRVADFHGLRFNGTYTWSHSLDNASNAVWANLPTSFNNLSIMSLYSEVNFGAFCLINGAGAAGVPCPSRIPPLLGVSEGSSSVTTTGASSVFTTPYYIPQDPTHFLRNDYGQSDFDVRHRFVADFTWDVPSLQKRWGWSKWLDYWSLSGVYVVQSGQPFTIFAGPVGGEVTQRINSVGTINFSDNPNAAITLTNPIRSLPGNAIDGCAAPPVLGSPLWNNNFANPGACIGNTGRNQFVGPYYNNFDLAVQKGFPIFGEGKMLSVRSEFFNLFGMDNFYNPNSVLSLDGVSFNPDFGKIQSAHDPRRIQLAVRFNF